MGSFNIANNNTIQTGQVVKVLKTQNRRLTMKKVSEAIAERQSNVNTNNVNTNKEESTMKTMTFKAGTVTEEQVAQMEAAGFTVVIEDDKTEEELIVEKIAEALEQSKEGQEVIINNAVEAFKQYQMAGAMAQDANTFDKAQYELKKSNLAEAIEVVLVNLPDDKKVIYAAKIEKTIQENDADELQKVLFEGFHTAIKANPGKKVSLMGAFTSLTGNLFKFTTKIVSGVFGFGTDLLKLIWKGAMWVFDHVKELALGLGRFVGKSLKALFDTTLDNIQYSIRNYSDCWTNEIVPSWNEDVVVNAVAFGEDVKKDFPDFQKDVADMFNGVLGKFKPATV